MKLVHLDIVALEVVLGHEAIAVPLGIPEAAIGLVEYGYNRLIETIASTKATMVDIEGALDILEAALKAYEIFQNNCTRDQIDEMISMGLLDPQEVELIDQIGAEQADICRRFGVPAEMEYFVFCALPVDMANVIIALGVGSVERDTNLVRDLLDIGSRQKALEYLTASVK